MEDTTMGVATPEEVKSTVKVMGGEDWKLWIEALADADVLAEGFKTVATHTQDQKYLWNL